MTAVAPAPASAGNLHERWRRGAALLALVTLGCTVWYVVDPDGVGGTAKLVLTTVLALLIATGPFWHRVRPRRVWFLVTLAGLLMAADVFSAFTDLRAGPFEYSDMVYLPAYAAILIWLILLGRVADGYENRVVVLDTAVACAGATLAVWSILLAPLTTLDDLVTGAIWTLYPPLDVAMCVLAVHLASRLGRVPVSLRWIIAATATWVVVDSVYAAVELRTTVAYDIPLLEVGDLFVHLAFALAFTHPRVGDLTPREATSAAPETGMRRSVFVMLTVVPGIVSTAVADVSPADRAIRTVLITLLLGLLFARLYRTIRALRSADADSRHRATHDSLTGLVNRAALHEAIAHRLRTAPQDGLATVLVFIDCDDFKRINDTWGHEAGDTLLQGVAGRLTSAAGPCAVVARQGGDEFVVLASVSDALEADDLLSRLRGTFDRPLTILPDRVHPTSASFGVAVVPAAEPCTTDELLRRADAAMYAAKQMGKGRSARFGRELAAAMERRALVGARLGAVMESDPFTIAMQPIMGGPTHGTLVGWEALARWEDPVLGRVAPDEFIPVAEDLGLIGAVGVQILRKALQYLSAARALHGDEDLAVSVNISPTQLRDPDFFAVVRRALDAAGVPPDSLHLELTESVLVEQADVVRATLERLRTHGVRICVDDFGTGYASLTTLLRLPIDCVKLDRSLVANVADDAAARRQLAAVLALVRSLEIEDIVAEGVETERQADVLRRLGCPLAQGWLYGRPQPWDGESTPAGRGPVVTTGRST